MTIKSLKTSAFADGGLRSGIDEAMREVAELYLADGIPWVVGYSGGKDSTATLQLVWNALSSIPAERRTKAVHVISTDTLVENPVVAAWANRSLERMGEAATAQGLPIFAHRLSPAVGSTFWVNLVGRGYPAPRPTFRWCTSRLKIHPSGEFIRSVVDASGEAIVVLGTRKAESAQRARTMNRWEEGRVRDRLSPNGNLPNSSVYSPIEDWTNDDVWTYLMQVKNPWGYRNKDLLTMYQGATEDGECPLVVEKGTPSCGDSRFGCWVCTLVENDKSMAAMIRNDDEKAWMLPLLRLRDRLDYRKYPNKSDAHLRDFRRMSGRVHVENDRVVPGPYLQHVRREWLAEILRAQRHVEANGPKDIGAIELITLAEIEEIRRIWVVEKNEVEDLVPTVWEEVYGTKYPGAALDDGLPFGAEELAILEELCGGDRLHYEMVRDLLCIEQRSGTTLKRGDLFTEFERAISKAFYSSPEDAVERARAQVSARDAAQARPSTLLDPVGCVEEARDDDDLEGNNAADEAILEVLA